MLVTATWRGRLEEQLGFFSCESNSGESLKLLNILKSKNKLYVMRAACEFLCNGLVDRELHSKIYRKTSELFEELKSPSPSFTLNKVERQKESKSPSTFSRVRVFETKILLINYIIWEIELHRVEFFLEHWQERILWSLMLILQ